MPLTAFLLALGSAFLHAAWNVLLAREQDVRAATAVSLIAAAVVFAPVAAMRWDADPRVWRFAVVTASLQLLYFALLAFAYDRAELSFVYPIARGVAPVAVLVVAVAFLGAGASVGQVAGVVLVGAGVILVRGLGSRHDALGLALALSIGGIIAAYTLVDKHGIRYADPIVYLELGTAPAAVVYSALLLARRPGRTRIRSSLRPAPVAAGMLSFGAYALVLAALSRAAAAPVAAVRETSVLFATVLAAALLREPVGPVRAIGVVVVVVGVAVLALA